MADEVIFTSKEGNCRVTFERGGGIVHGHMRPSQSFGWRATSDGGREHVVYSPFLGWRTEKVRGPMDTKSFPGHLAIWYEEEERRNPGWRDYDPPEENAQ